MPVLRRPLLALARSGRVKEALTTLPVASSVVRGYVPGESTDDAIGATTRLLDDGLAVTIDHLGEDTLDAEQAEATTRVYLHLLDQLAAHGLARRAEVSLKLSAVGRALPGTGTDLALENAHRVCEAARAVGTTVTLDMEDHTGVDATLTILRELRREHPDTGAVLQAYLRRTEADARDLAYEGSRVRLCKGAYDEPSGVAFQTREEVDRAFVRCLRILMAGQGYPMVATHDPRLIRIAGSLASRHGRHRGTYEYQMLYGIRPEEQRRLAAEGETVRVYVPYGTDWYGYLTRRLAERPQNLSLFVTSLISKK
ncbi:proline dehydrogenase family protein [Nocardioides sp. ChNu-99]|uniref:proline dehydrogenase family protein n=1 Tax=unclassified Nocardioides TaxID=2615069 RepID=UPI00240725D0|nr:proline dehydrogenase family protein [Nocardioides sp. ChNu-99]MDF9717120.1 proline dehydrogenase family protein [Nocardioides sp. ChNu-99]